MNGAHDPSPFGFRSGRSSTRAALIARGVIKRPLDKAINLDAPPPFAPDCPIEERDAAIEAIDKMHRERPLRPPGR